MGTELRFPSGTYIVFWGFAGAGKDISSDTSGLGFEYFTRSHVVEVGAGYLVWGEGVTAPLPCSWVVVVGGDRLLHYLVDEGVYCTPFVGSGFLSFSVPIRCLFIAGM